MSDGDQQRIYNGLVVCRDLSPSVSFTLASLLQDSDLNRLGAEGWEKFYEFAAACYRSPQKSRPSLSQLSDIFRANGAEHPGRLAVTYAHCLYAIAMYEGAEIYGDGFNP